MQLDSAYTNVFADLGIEPVEVLRRAGLRPDLFTSDSPSLSVEETFKFVQALDEVANDPILAIRFAKAIDTNVFSPMLFAALCAETFREAVHRVCEFKAIQGPKTVQVVEKGASTTLEFDWKPLGTPPALLLHMEILFWVRLGRLGTRRVISPTKYQGPEFPDPVELALFLGCEPKVSRTPLLVFGNEDMDRPFVTASAEMWSYFEPGLRHRLRDIEHPATHADQITAILHELLPTGRPSIEAVAHQMGLGARTLQRRLADERTTYGEVLAATRESLALHYLQDLSLAIKEISLLLGFDEPGSFDRSFTTWTGRTPSAHRQDHRRAPEPQDQEQK